MSKIKNFDPALYKSHFEAVKHFIQEGRHEEYDFNVCTKKAAENALAYLCINDIPHHYHTVGLCGLYCMTIGWEIDGQDYAYCFWCEGEV
jgi:hypothetical protein